MYKIQRTYYFFSFAWFMKSGLMGIDVDMMSVIQIYLRNLLNLY